MKAWMLALRTLVRRPGFTLTVVGLIALGIAANTALFSLVDTVLLRPLPYPDPDRLVSVMETNSAKDQKTSLIAPGRIEDWNRLSTAFEAVSGLYSENVTDTSGGEPERLTGVRVAPRYFEVFAAPAAAGRVFLPDEERDNGPKAAVISYGLWSRRYGNDPRVTEKRLLIGGDAYRIVGVAPRDFTSSPIDVWIPAQTSAWLLGQRDARFLSGVARLKPGISIARAQADLARVQQALGEQYPATDRGWSASVQDLKQARIGDSGKPIVMLFAAVALLLSIAVTNVASLAVSRLDGRRREIAIRFSIGGTRAQIVGALFREAVWIAVAGAAAGSAAAALAVGALPKVFAHTPRIGELRMDWRAVAFAALVSGLAAVAFGLLPALRATSGYRAGIVIRAGRGSAARGRILQPALVVGQIALTMTLLAGSGLLLRSFRNLTRAELGYDPSHTLVFHVGARWDEDRGRVGRMQEALVSGLNRLPGVEAAGIVNFLPVSGATLRYPITLEGSAGSQDIERMPPGSRTVSPGYLKAIHASLLAGGWCPELRLDWQGPAKAMVNRRFAEVYARGENVVGRHLQFPQFRSANPQVEIVGVIGDIREDAVESAPYPFVYNCARAGAWPDPEYVIRASGDPRSILNAVREQVRRLEPDRAIFGVRTMDETLDAALDRPRTSAEALTAFSLAAMLLAAVGLYSLVAQFVAARRQEIGIRLALGATPGKIVGGLLGSAGRLTAYGIAVGVGLTLAGQRLIQSLLFGVGALDALSFGSAAALLAAVAIGAALLPARRAAAIDPVESMRAE